MDIFYSLLFKLLPLYGLIAFGYVVGKFVPVKKETVATVVIYGITPIIVFNAVLTTPISGSTAVLPFVTLAMGCIICLLFYSIGKLHWRDSTKNALGFIAGEVNTGYFGLPVAILLFNKPTVELYIVAAIGILLYESTLGFFIAARGHFTLHDSVVKLLKLPAVYAILLGLVTQSTQIHFSPLYDQTIVYAKYLYTIVGMMIIGMGIADVKQFSFDRLFIGLSFLATFIAWPLFVFLVIVLDNTMLHLFTVEMHRVLILIALMPVAANTVAFATMLKLHPEKVAVTVILSTIFALVYVPFMVSLFLR